MVQASLKYNDDPQLLLDIISAMPKRVDNTLTLYRNIVAPHYQSIVPFKHNDILQHIADNGGFSVSVTQNQNVEGQFHPVLFLIFLRF